MFAPLIIGLIAGPACPCMIAEVGRSPRLRAPLAFAPLAPSSIASGVVPGAATGFHADRGERPTTRPDQQPPARDAEQTDLTARRSGSRTADHLFPAPPGDDADRLPVSCFFGPVHYPRCSRTVSRTFRPPGQPRGDSSIAKAEKVTLGRRDHPSPPTVRLKSPSNVKARGRPSSSSYLKAGSAQPSAHVAGGADRVALAALSCCRPRRADR